MAKIKLTAGKIRDFSCPLGKSQAFIWDTEAPGLGIRATNRIKAYIFQGKLKRKTPDGTKREAIRVKIGDVRSWLLDQNAPDKPPGARQEARRLKALIDQGIDPRIEKQERMAEQEAKRDEKQRAEHIVKDVWATYLKIRKKNWSDRHYDDHVDIAKAGGEPTKRGNGIIKPGPLAVLMPLKLTDLTRDRIKSWAEKEGESRGARARLAFSLLRTFINWCNRQPEYKGLIPPDAIDKHIKQAHIPKMKSKDDCLQKEQLPAWFKAVRELSNPVISAYLQTLLLIGARREELAGLKWDDIDFQWDSLTIHDKVDGERTIPMTPYVRHLLSPLPRRNEWVFSSPTAESGRVHEPRHGHNRALAVAGIDGLTLHGLRRSFGTLSEWVEVPTGIVAQIQGHKPSAIAEKHYRRRPLDLLRLWHVKIEKWILDEAGIQQPKNGSEKPIQLVKS